MKIREIQEEILRLKKERDFCILAHSYQTSDILEIADFTGDSYALSVKAKDTPQKNVLMCGVRFMAETVKILSPEKNVYLSNPTAGCPMAEQMDKEMIRAVKMQYPDYTVVAYINTTAELKTICDVCVTSSNALKIVKKLPNEHIFFIPDENLGRFVAKQVPEKNFIFNDGYCHVHASIRKDQVEAAKKAHPNAPFIVHPECRPEILDLADFIGSTSEIIDYASSADAKEFIIGTELGVLYELKKQNPDKIFYSAGSAQCCPNMKKITLEKIVHVLETGEHSMSVTDEMRTQANRPLERMLELAK